MSFLDEQRLACPLPEGVEQEFHATFSPKFLEHLDKGHGACVLRRGELAQIVANSLRHFDGERDLLGGFVVMSNHVHLLVGLLGTTDIEAQCHSWKKFSARQIDPVLCQTGEFWQPESFDHLVRNAEQFERFQRYIAENGRSVGLRDGEYFHWTRLLFNAMRYNEFAIAIVRKDSRWHGSRIG